MPRSKKTIPEKKPTKKVSAKVVKANRQTNTTKHTNAAKSDFKSSRPQLSARDRAQKVTAYLGENIRKPKVFITLIVVVLLILAYIFKNLFVVALVNGQPISRIEYNQQLEAQAGKQVMNSLVTQSLLEQEAARRNISISQSDIDAQVRTIQNQLAGQGQTLDSALAAQGLSKDAFMQQLRLQALVQKMLASKISVSDAEINSYISANQSSLPTGQSQSQIKAQVKQQLQQQKLSAQAQALVQQLQAKAHITYFVNL